VCVCARARACGWVGGWQSVTEEDSQMAVDTRFFPTRCVDTRLVGWMLVHGRLGDPNIVNNIVYSSRISKE